MEKNDIFGDHTQVRKNPEAVKIAEGLFQKALALAKERAPGKDFNAVLTGGSGKMDQIAVLSIPKGQIGLKTISPWEMTLFGTTTGGIFVLSPPYMRWSFPEIAVFGRFEPGKYDGDYPIYPFTDFACVHFSEIWDAQK